MEELVELWRRVDDLRELRDASGLSGDRALEAARAVARVRTAADALLAPYAARVDELSAPGSITRFARWKGFPNAASLLSHATGLSVAEAGKLIGLGHTLADAGVAVSEPPAWAVFETDEVASPEPEAEPEATVPRDEPRVLVAPTTEPPFVAASALPPLADAIRRGTLGTEKANIIRRTLEDMVIDTTDVERFLVERAGELSLVELRRLCLAELARRDPAGHAAREARQSRARFLKFYEEPDGMIALHGRFAPADAAPIKAWFEAEMQAQVFAQRDLPQGEQRSLGQVLADVFVATARHASGCTRATSRAKTTVVIHAGKTDLERREGIAWCDGIEAPFTLATALAMAVDPEFEALLIGENGDPLNLGRAQRSANDAQRHALALRDKGCAMCSTAIARCDAHHIVNWQHGGRTDVANMVMLCVGCHHRIHDYGWDIVIEDNQVWFIPPASVDPHRRRQPGSSARLAA